MAIVVPIGGCCTPCSPPYDLCDICEGTCPSGQLLPCAICLEVTSLSFTSTVPDCGPVTVSPLPKPVVVADSILDRPFYYVGGELFADTLTDAGGPYRSIQVRMNGICSDDGSLTGTLEYYLGDVDCGDSPPYGNFLQAFEIPIPTACDFTPLYGEHTFTLSNSGGMVDITAELVIVITPGDSCAVDPACCDTGVSQVLRFSYGDGSTFVTGQLEWDGSQWVCTNRTNGLTPYDPGLDTANIYIECVGTDWHLVIDGYFDETAASIDCAYRSAALVSATDGTYTMTVLNP